MAGSHYKELTEAIKKMTGSFCEMSNEFKARIAEALLKYLCNGVGEIDIDEVVFTMNKEKPEWVKLSLWFKLDEGGK